ncbi:MAG TPA: hypothetical protein VHQ46_02965 [Desulfobacteria bacterium]|nr:hypothetical protein [Desulfobacteria bacterium]
MRADNEMCIQRVRIVFTFFAKNPRQVKGNPFLTDNSQLNLWPASLRGFSQRLTKRLERIAAAMELLLTAHSDWVITGKNDRIIMETETWDFTEILNILEQQGFRAEEFAITVEYTRKWGVL